MIIWADGEVTEIRARWPGAVELTATRSDTDGDGPGAGVHRPDPGPGGRATGCCSTSRRWTAAWAPAATHWWSPSSTRPAGSAPSRRSRPDTWSRRATCRCRPWWPAPTSRAPRTTSCSATPTRWTGCRWWWPTCTPPSPRSPWRSPHDRPGTRVVYVMTDQGALPLAFSRSYAELREAGLLAGSVTVGSGLRRRPGGGHGALRAAGRPAGPGRRPGGPHPGPGQPGHRHPLGLLRRGGRGGGQRGGRAGRSAGRLAAGVGRRPAGAAPRRVAPQPDRVRAGGPAALRHRGAGLRRRARPGEPGRAAWPGPVRVLERRHDLVPVDLTGLLSLLVESPIRLSSMGRGVHDDPGYFLAAAAAGRHAAGLVSPERRVTAPPG